jgi:hypothetical protein
MKDKLLKFILDKDYEGVLTWGVNLTDKERYEAIDALMSIDIDDELKHLVNPDPFKRSRRGDAIYLGSVRVLHFIALCCVRSVEDVYLTEDYKDRGERNIHYCKAIYYLERQSFDKVYFEKYLTMYSPTYIADIFKTMVDGESFVFFNKYALWLLNHKGYIQIEEEAMVSFFYDIPMFDYDTREMVDFFIEKKEAIDDVLLPFYKYDLNVLDRSKWNSTKNGYVCAVVTTFWDEVFQELIAKGQLTDRSIIANLLGSLTNSWKKGRLDWHVRLIKMFKPTKAEYLQHQELLFSALSSSSLSVRNYAVGELGKLYKEKGFDKELFLQSVPYLFMQEKQNKALLTVIAITDYVVSSDVLLSTYIPEYVALLLQPNEEVQTKAAELLVKYIDSSELDELVSPYTATLKRHPLEVLGVTKIEEESIVIETIEHNEVILPRTWEDFLFHVGKTIESEAVLDIDVLYESAITYLKDLTKVQIKQLTPHIKRAERKPTLLSSYIHELLYNCVNRPKVFRELVTMKIRTDFKKHYKGYLIEDVENELSLVHTNEVPLLRAKNIALWKEKYSMKTFLSTPTHEPFYVHPKELVTKLLLLEQQGHIVSMDDLIVGCNRVLKKEITTEVQTVAKQLKGEYREAILYLLGVTDEITLQDKYLPLWTQVARTKHSDKVFKEFSDTWCKDLPTVVSPLLYDYELVQHTSWRSEDEFYYELELVDYNTHSVGIKQPQLEDLYYYTRSYSNCNSTYEHNRREITSKDKVRTYELSLVPHYFDICLISKMTITLPLQYMIENQMIVKDNGWVYICFNLLFDDKTSRLLAREYIKLAVGLDFFKNEYVSTILATMLIHSEFPVNRFVEYLDNVTTREEKVFQWTTIAKCIEKAELGKLPTGFKKLMNYYDELSNALEQAPQEHITQKRKALKL